MPRLIPTQPWFAPDEETYDLMIAYLTSIGFHTSRESFRHGRVILYADRRCTRSTKFRVLRRGYALYLQSLCIIRRGQHWRYWTTAHLVKEFQK